MKKAHKRIALALAAALTTLICTACGSGNQPAQSQGGSGSDAKTPDPGTVYTWRIGYGSAGTEENNPAIYYMNRVKERAEELSDGRLSVEVYTASALGTTQELPAGLVDGTVDSALLPTQFCASIIPDLFVFDVSGQFDSAEQLLDILNNNDTVIQTHAVNKGIRIAAWLQLFPRYTMSTKEVTNVSDLKGLKLWFATSALVSNKATSVGAIPCNFSGSDLAVSLQNGTVDGTWSDVSLMNNFALYDFAKYVIRSPGDPMIAMLGISEAWFQTLPEDLQEIVLQVSQECVSMQQVRCLEVQDSLEQTLIDHGVQIIDPSDQFKADFAAATAGEAEWLLSEYPEVEEFYHELQDYVNG